MPAAVLRSDDAAVWGRYLGANSVRENRQSAVHGLQPKASNDLACEYSDVSGLKGSHVSVPSSPHQSGLERVDMEQPTVARKPADHRDEVRSGLHLALVTKIPQYKNPAKNVAAATGASEATVRSLRQQNIPEAMVTLVMLGRTFPDFRTEVARLMGMERDLDPEFQREFAQLLRRVL